MTLHPWFTRCPCCNKSNRLVCHGTLAQTLATDNLATAERSLCAVLQVIAGKWSTHHRLLYMRNTQLHTCGKGHVQALDQEMHTHAAEAGVRYHAQHGSVLAPTLVLRPASQLRLARTRCCADPPHPHLPAACCTPLLVSLPPCVHHHCQVTGRCPWGCH